MTTVRPVPVTEATFANRLKRKLAAKRAPAAPRVTKGAPLGAAIVGVGNVAKWAYLPRLRAGGGFVLKGVLDVNCEAAESVAREFNARAYGSLDELIADESLAVVFVCSPPKFHRGPVVEALQRNLHVLCEKPLAASIDDARAMRDAANAAPSARTMINFSYRFKPEIAHFIDIVRSGMLGDVYHVSGTLSQGMWFGPDGQPTRARGDEAAWRFQQGGGVVHELGSHLADLLCACFGDAARVGAWARTFQPGDTGCENACGASIEFRGGPVAHVVTSRCATGFKEHTSLEVSGTLGALQYVDGVLRLWTRDAPRWRALLPPAVDGPFLDAFRAAIDDPTRAVPSIQDGYRNCEVLDAMLESARAGRFIEL
ncbi:MAG: Gfo/Idh/MocA family oxidoreductase [Candidatus Hydrogenedentes bacterium]|nr:Gfo/Idh/MocA family oxidoreductase [Candidatus Hydrogenedentota bacterium]